MSGSGLWKRIRIVALAVLLAFSTASAEAGGEGGGGGRDDIVLRQVVLTATLAQIAALQLMFQMNSGLYYAEDRSPYSGARAELYRYLVAWMYLASSPYYQAIAGQVLTQDIQ